MRTEFSKLTKRLAFTRADGKCEHPGCGLKLFPGKFRYDHRIPDYLGGDNLLENCQVICTACDGEKTYKQDIPTIAKVKRIRDREAGIRKPRTIRAWKRFGGSIVYAPRER